jgi:hypothetical protein
MYGPVSLQAVTTVYTKKEDLPVELGVRFTLNPMELLKGTSIGGATILTAGGGGFSQWDTLKTGLNQFGPWEVMAVEAGATITVGQLVMPLLESVTADATGSTTTIIKTSLTNGGTDLWKGAMGRVTHHNTATGNEGALVCVTANTSTTITFTPAITTATGTTGSATIMEFWKPTMVMPSAAAKRCYGVALAASGTIATSGAYTPKYIFVLCKGLYLAPATIPAGSDQTGASAAGYGLIAGNSGGFAYMPTVTEGGSATYSAQVQCVGYLPFGHPLANATTIAPVFVNCME